VRWETGTDGERYLRRYQEPCPEGMTRTEWGNCTSTANVPPAPVGDRDDGVRSYDSSTPANQLPVIGGTSTTPFTFPTAEYENNITNKVCNRDSDCSTTIPGALSKCFVDGRSLSPVQREDLMLTIHRAWSPNGADLAAINSFVATLSGVTGACHVNKPRFLFIEQGETCPTGYRANSFGGLCDLIMD
jgi:hypothetical protein